MSRRFQTTRTRGGTVVQSGLDIRHRSDPHSAATPKLGLYRGLVVKTYIPRDAEGANSGDVRRGGQIECDVLLIRTHSFVQKAIVIQRGNGVNEAHGLWIPREATRTLDGSPLNFQVMGIEGNFEGVATAFDNTDGDMVVIQFMEGDPDYPVVTGAITHEQSNRVVRKGSGWAKGQSDQGVPYQNEYYLHHQGTELRVNEAGDLLLDTVGAYSDRATEDNGASSGDLRLRIKDGQRFTIAMGNDEDTLEVYKAAGQLRIDLGKGASERVVLGDTFLNLFNSHTHTGVLAGGVNSGAPTVPLTDSVLSDLAKTKKS